MSENKVSMSTIGSHLSILQVAAIELETRITAQKRLIPRVENIDIEPFQ